MFVIFQMFTNMINVERTRKIAGMCVNRHGVVIYETKFETASKLTILWKNIPILFRSGWKNTLNNVRRKFEAVFKEKVQLHFTGAYMQPDP